MDSDLAIAVSIGVVYLAGFITGVLENLYAFLVILAISLIIGLAIQFTDYAEDVKEALGGLPAVVVPVATVVCGLLGSGVKWIYDYFTKL